jgi:hypothetical protein
MKRYDAIKAIRDRLEQISTSNGYLTDAGALIFIGEAAVLEHMETNGDEVPEIALAVMVGTDEVIPAQGEKVVSILPVEVQALAKASLPEPQLTAEQIIHDVKKAVEQEDRTLGGLLLNRGLERGVTRVIDREPGGYHVGIGVMYRLALAEPWGQP